MRKTKLTASLLIASSILVIACNGNQELDEEAIQQKTVTIKKPKFLIPTDDKILLFIGQDSDTISDYIAAVPEDNIEGVTLYSQLKNVDPSQTLKAIFSPEDWHAGTVDFNKTLNDSPSAAIAVGLAFDTCNQANHEKKIAQGKYDKTIKVMVEHFKSLSPRKVFLRIGYEFDGPWNCYTPNDYKLAFQRISKAIKHQDANNIATVWQSASWPDSYGNPIYDTGSENHLSNWYPGDEYVDWVSMSVFYQGLSQWNYTPPRTPALGQEDVLSFARAHNKPVMISESAPQGYRVGELTKSVIQENAPHTVTAQQIWQDWYQSYFDFIYANKDVIRAVAYINTHWDSQAMWQCKEGIPAGTPGCNQGNWGDSRIQANEYIKSKWLEQVNNPKIWIQTGQY